MSKRQRADGALFPRWIHVVQRKEVDDVEDDWEGQIGAIKKTMRAVEAKVGATEAKMEAKMGAIEAQMGAIEAKMGAGEAKMDQMLALLAKLAERDRVVE